MLSSRVSLTAAFFPTPDALENENDMANSNGNGNGHKNDMELKVLMTTSLHLNLKRSAKEDDRTLSGYCRRILTDHANSTSLDEEEQPSALLPSRPNKGENQVEVRILLSEQLYSALKDLAKEDDRALSPYCRRILSNHENELSRDDDEQSMPEPSPKSPD